MLDLYTDVSVQSLGGWTRAAPAGDIISNAFGGDVFTESIPLGNAGTELVFAISGGVSDLQLLHRYVLSGITLRIQTFGNSIVRFERLQIVTEHHSSTDFEGLWFGPLGVEEVRERFLGSEVDALGLPGGIRLDDLLPGFRLIVSAYNTSSKGDRTAELRDVEVTLHLIDMSPDNETAPASLLPQNATAQERAIERAIARPVPVGVRSVWDPDTCPSRALPWLAWALSVDQWNSSWTDEQKRDAIRTAVAVQRQKGTAGAVRDALAALSIDARVLEWHRQQVVGNPYTYRLFVEAGPDAPVTSLAALERAIATVDRVKSLRSHLEEVHISTLSAGGPRVVAATTLGHEIVVSYGGQLS